MNLNETMYWLVGAGYVTLFFATKQFRTARRDWLIAAQIPLVLGVVTWLYTPLIAGVVAAIAWILLMVFPPLLTRMATPYATQNRWQRASLLLGLAALLHPNREWRRRFACGNAAALVERGQLQKARVTLEKLAQERDPSSAIAQALLFQLSGDWQGLRQWLRFNHAFLQGEPLIPALILEARALGETLNVRQLMEHAGHALQRLRKNQISQELASEFVDWVLAYTGNFYALSQREKQKGDQFFHKRNRALYRYQQAIALEIMGPNERAQQAFQELARDRNGFIAMAASDHLEQPRQISPDLPEIIAKPGLQFAEIMLQLRPVDPLMQVQTQNRRPWVTWWLISANLFVFLLVEVRGGARYDWVYEDMGAMIPAKFFQGEWWRLLTSMFMHHGPLHLGFNMLGLFALGKFVEQRLGGLALFLIYMLNGLGSMAIVAWLMAFNGEAYVMIVGASGAIMGLVGLLCAAWFRAWRSKRLAQLGSARFLPLAILLQVVFDFMNPEISMSAHLIGTAIGFILGLFVFRKKKAGAIDNL